MLAGSDESRLTTSWFDILYMLRLRLISNQELNAKERGGLSIFFRAAKDVVEVLSREGGGCDRRAGCSV